jgi:hypothetical protein
MSHGLRRDFLDIRSTEPKTQRAAQVLRTSQLHKDIASNSGRHFQHHLLQTFESRRESSLAYFRGLTAAATNPCTASRILRRASSSIVLEVDSSDPTSERYRWPTNRELKSTKGLTRSQLRVLD